MTEPRRPTLTAPFANTSELSKGGKSFTYVPAAEVVERLNAVLGYGGWSFEVPDAFQVDKFIVAKGRLSALGAVYEQYGGHQIQNNTDMGDNYKSACSDAMKKCAAMMGVALYLSLGRNPTPFSAAATAEAEAITQPRDGSGAGQTPPDPAPPVEASGGSNQGEDGSPSSSQRSTSAASSSDTNGGGIVGEVSPTAVLQLILDIQALKGRARAEVAGERTRLKITDLEGLDPDSEEFRLLRAKTSAVMA